MKNPILFVLFCGIIASAFSQDPSYRKKLYYSCKVWGFVKYYHSMVSEGQVNWDSVLIANLPLVKSAATQDDFNDVLMSMFLAAGPMEIATTPSPDTLPPELKRNLNSGWIEDPMFRGDIKVLLNEIKDNFRPHPIVWVTQDWSKGYLGFPYDDPMLKYNASLYYPDEFTRLLILFKYWNIINYFNPYNYVLDIPWDSTLLNNAITFANDPDYEHFFKSFKRMAANLDDAHVEGFTYSNSYSFYGSYSPQIIVRYIENRYVVVKSAIDDISPGDILLSIDSLPTLQLEDSLRPYISAGNPSVFRREMCRRMLCGSSGSLIKMEIIDSLGLVHPVSATRNTVSYDNWFVNYFPNDSLAAEKWKLWNCNVGYVNVNNLFIQEVDSMYNRLKNADAIIFDLRKSQNGTGSALADAMYPGSIAFSKLLYPDINYPGTYYWTDAYCGKNSNTASFSGKVIILCNQQTQSSAEFTSMVLQAMPNSVLIGSQTAGADGNVSFFRLSTEFHTGFSSLGVFYPDGDSTQRIGLVPDSLVNPTATGIRQGRDEVLEKALQTAGCLVPVFSVNPQSVNAAASGGSTTFTVISNTNWTAVSDAEWCTVTFSGYGNGSITAIYTENTTYQNRIVNISITIAGMPARTVTVNQAKSTIGIEEQNEDHFSIFPNPTNGLLTFVPPRGDRKTIELRIQDLHGRIILKKQFKENIEYGIDLSSFPEGIYFIFINTEANRSVHKLILK